MHVCLCVRRWLKYPKWQVTTEHHPSSGYKNETFGEKERKRQLCVCVCVGEEHRIPSEPYMNKERRTLE